MALLNVTEVLLDPLLNSRFTVVRRISSVDAKGRETPVEKLFQGVIGVVTPSSPSDLDRQEDYQTYSRSITVVTKFPLQGSTNTTQPDIVVWMGSRYLVNHVDSCAQFGPGFYEAECSSIQKADGTIGVDAPAAAKFNLKTNSQYGAILCG